MSNPATDSIPIIRRAGYNPIPEMPFTGPMSIQRRFAIAPPVSVEAVLSREDYVPPVAGHPEVEGSDEGLRAPRLMCRCKHPHGLHEEMRRGDRCTRCRCQGFDPEPVLPTTAEETKPAERMMYALLTCLVGVAGVAAGSALTVALLTWQGFLP